MPPGQQLENRRAVLLPSLLQPHEAGSVPLHEVVSALGKRRYRGLPQFLGQPIAQCLHQLGYRKLEHKRSLAAY